MENLIKALQIFLKYGNPTYPTHCDNETLYINGYDWEKISKEDQEELEFLGFFYDNDHIVSYRYGSY